MLFGLVNIHLPAEDDEAADLLQRRPPHARVEGIQAREADASLGKASRRNPKGVVPIVPDAKHRVHRPRRMIEVWITDWI